MSTPVGERTDNGWSQTITLMRVRNQHVFSQAKTKPSRVLRKSRKNIGLTEQSGKPKTKEGGLNRQQLYG